VYTYQEQMQHEERSLVEPAWTKQDWGSWRKLTEMLC